MAEEHEMDMFETTGSPPGNGAGVYLYCFGRPGAVRGLPLTGIEGCEGVATLEVNGAAAVYSEVLLAEFERALAEPSTPDPGWLIPRACRHERIIEQVMSRSPVLPVRFGAVFSSREMLAHVLAEHAEEIRRFLDDVGDKEEWSVKGFLDMAKAEAGLLAGDPVLRAEQDRLPELPGARYFREKSLHREACRRALSWGREVAQRVGEELERQAVDFTPLKLAGLHADGKEVLLHVAVLLRRDGVGDFHSLVERLSGDYSEGGFALDLSGPWPPYNFCPSLETNAESLS